MAYTEADLLARITALETAFDRHERTVKFADREVTYSSASEIKERINYFKTELRGLRRGGRQFRLVGDKGLS